MNVNINKQASRIADAIVQLVERTDGPVTLARVDREVAGFAKDEPPAWEYVVTYASGEMSYWCDMTEAGVAALRNVMDGRRVAVQFVNPLLYIFLEGRVFKHENWQPIVLLPARAANVDSPNWLIRAPEYYQEYVARAAANGKTGHRLLTPAPVRFTADAFFDVNTGG
jgi:hypothetical protein